MIHRMDPPADPDHRPPPRDLRPMTATPGKLPSGKGWAFEVEWPGRRSLLINEPGLTLIDDASGADVSAGFPEVRRIGRALGATEVVLDGVITAGRPRLDRSSTGREVGQHGAPAGSGSSGVVRRLRPAVVRRPVVRDEPWTGATRTTRRPRAGRQTRGRCPPLTSATAPRCSKRRAAKASTPSSPNARRRRTDPARQSKDWIRIPT